jgi:hypothetical protein
MRKLIIGAFTAAALLGVPTAAGAATAASPWQPLYDPLGCGATATSSCTLPLPGGTFCAFNITAAVVTNKEFEDVTKLSDGTMVTQVKGNLVLSFTNDTTGNTIKKNVSGPSTYTQNPDGSSTFQGEGLNWLAFGPGGQRNTGEPGLIFTKGQVTATFQGPTAQKFSLNGTQENGCTLLS